VALPALCRPVGALACAPPPNVQAWGCLRRLAVGVHRAQVRACEGLVLCAAHRRDIGFLFVAVQLAIAIIAKAVHLLDSGEVIPTLFPKEWAANRVATVLSVGPYYCTGAVLFFAGAPPPASSNRADLKMNHAVIIVVAARAWGCWVSALPAR
jgi:hypothetical protein